MSVDVVTYANELIVKLVDKIGRITYHENPTWNLQPGLTSVRISLDFPYRIVSWGTGADRSIALSKAMLELVERAYFLNTSEKTCTSTSSGIALHQSIKLSNEHACAELVERHVIIKSCAENIPGFQILDKRGYSVVCWRGPLDYFVCLAILPLTPGFLFSSAASKSLQEAISKTEEELNGMGAWRDTPNEWKRFSFGNLQDEGRNYFLKQKRAPGFLLVTGEGEVGPEIRELDVSYEQLPHPLGFESLDGFCFVSRASCNKLQPMFFGPWSDNVINKKAIDISKYNPENPYHVLT